MEKRELFKELVDGIDDINAFHESKITLRRYHDMPEPPIAIEPELIVKIRGKMSQGVFS
ncbi:MAG: hypothetical protein HQL75_09785 [Magnetococcales bacterium]|nr:hypothetical protein [Magnetococcales bacterium]